jgi:hypothetical protein
MSLFYYPQIDVISIDTLGFRVAMPGETIEFYNVTQDVSITSIIADSFGSLDAGSFNDASEPVALDDVVELRHATYDGTARIVLKATALEAANAIENNNASLILEDNYSTIDPDAGVIIVADLDDPSIEPYILGNVQTAGETSLPFSGVVGKTYRFYVARQQADWDFHAASLELLSYQDLYISDGTGDAPPSFTSVTYDSANSEVDMVFAKSGTAVGNIEVEYKLTTSSTWTTHGTTFAHGATSGSIVITEQPTALTYDIRLKQVDVPGYSTIRQVTVDASAGGGTPPSNLTAFKTLVGGPPLSEYEIQLDWDAGSGSGNYTVEEKVGSTGSWTELTNSEASLSFLVYPVFADVTSRTYYYRVKQNDVTGYSNQASVYIPGERF